MGKAIYSSAEARAAITRIRNEAQFDELQPHHLAAELMEDCRKNNDIEGMKFWRAVWIQIMSDDYLIAQPKTKRSLTRPQLPGEGG
jgi:hypothetical protein